MCELMPDRIWDLRAMRNGLQIWKDLSERGDWEYSLEQQRRLSLIFGSSWYFGRFVCFMGSSLLPLLALDSGRHQQDVKPVLDGLLQKIDDTWQACPDTGDVDRTLDESLHLLRIGKNTAMLYVLLLYLQGVLDQEGMEFLLTRIADRVLMAMMHLFGFFEVQDQVFVIGMGRLAADEMNFGSDLDMVFLARENNQYLETLVGKVRRMLRASAEYDPAGGLYEIDMRLRPHGSSGILIIPCDKFFQFHRQQREVWERQMMTRHRLVFSPPEISEWMGCEIRVSVYQQWPSEWLRTGIRETRARVEESLGRVAGSFDIKRSPGGLMDIDFITHYFQLSRGFECPQLQHPSTREVLRQLPDMSLLSQDDVDILLSAYDYFKRAECALRVFDMKNIDVLSINSSRLPVVAKALGHVDADENENVQEFLHKCHDTAHAVRSIFDSVLG